MSLPTRGAWIEILADQLIANGVTVSLPTRGAWIEIISDYNKFMTELSLPTRGAWIEILFGFSLRHRDACRSPRGERG